MKSLRFLDRRIGFSLGAATILLGMVAPAVVPAFASADNQVTTRSMQMSSSAESAGGVSYITKFTPITSGSATYDGGTGVTDVYVMLLFCNNSPLPGTSCTAPSGMSMTGASVDSSDTTATLATTGANYAIVSIPIADVTAGTPLTIDLDGITNPNGTDLTSQSGTFYGRMETFDTQAHAAADEAGAETDAAEDSGGVALAVDSSIGVDASVLESLSFCTFGDTANSANVSTTGSDALNFPANTTGTTPTAPTANCNTAGTPATVASPSINLGENIGGSATNRALSTSNPSYALDWAQLSTNANSGAVVYLKTNNKCAGLGVITPTYTYDNNTTCGIPAPAAGGALSNGAADFGVNVLPGVAASGGTANGTVTVNSNYAGTASSGTVTPKFFMGNSSAPAYSDTLNGTGLEQDTTSTYGGYLFGSSGTTINNENVPLEFGGSISNQTPAGIYQANLNLIAVGKF